MNQYISRFLDEVNAGKVQECTRLSRFDGISEKDILDNADLLNQSLIVALKENLHNLKGKFLYDFVVGAYQKSTKFSILFDAASLILADNESAENIEESDKGTLHPAMNIDMFLLSVSHLTSLMQQQIQSDDQKSLVSSILKLIALFAEQKEIQNICRRQKFLTTFLKLFSEIVLNVQPSEFETADESHLAVLTTHIIAKLLLGSKKNQDYLMKKKAHELFQPVFLAGEKNILMFSACTGILVNLASTSEARQLLWQRGVVAISKKSIQSSVGNLRILELNYLLLSRLAHDQAEVIDDFIKDDTGLLQSIGQILAFQDFQEIQYQKSENMTCYGLSLKIIKKISSLPAHRSAFMKKNIKYPLNYINKITEWMNQTEKQQQISALSQSQQPSQGVLIFALKQAIALLTTFCLEEEGRQQGLKLLPKLISNIIKLTIQHILDAKLVTVVLGCLTNLSASQQGRQESIRDSSFGQLINSILDKYDDNPAIVSLCLKLMLNCFQDSEFISFLNTPKVILKLLFLGFAYQKHVLVVDLTNKLLRFLSSNPKVIRNILNGYRSFESEVSSFKFATILVNQIKFLLSNGQKDSVLDTLQLVASLCIIDKQLIQELQEKTDFVLVIKDILETNRSNQNDLQIFQATLAYLPLEEFKTLLTI